VAEEELAEAQESSQYHDTEKPFAISIALLLAVSSPAHESRSPSLS